MGMPKQCLQKKQPFMWHNTAIENKGVPRIFDCRRPTWQLTNMANMVPKRLATFLVITILNVTH